MEIRTKILLAPSIVIALVLKLSSFGWLALRQQAKSLDEIVSVLNAAVTLATSYLDRVGSPGFGAEWGSDRPGLSRCRGFGDHGGKGLRGRQVDHRGASQGYPHAVTSRDLHLSIAAGECVALARRFRDSLQRV
jgi:hypothetical protein